MVAITNGVRLMILLLTVIGSLSTANIGEDNLDNTHSTSTSDSAVEPSPLPPPLEQDESQDVTDEIKNDKEETNLETEEVKELVDEKETNELEGGETHPKEESEDDKRKQDIEIDDTKYKEGIKLLSKINFEEKAKGYELLKEAVVAGSDKAKEQLAYGYLYGHVLKRNFSKAYEIFNELAEKGVPSGQQGLGFMYSMGIGVNSSQAKAILYYTFGALGGHSYAQMIAGYRAFHGVATPQSCEMALTYYRKVATKVANEASIFAGGHVVHKARLTDEEEEYSIFAGVTEEEVDHYKEVFADSGAQLSLGLYYLMGLGGVERNLPQALELLERVDTPQAYALIGRIYAEGSPPEIQQSNETAIKYFKKAIEHKVPEGYTGLGIMYFHGMGVEKDYFKAMEYFQKAADKGSAEAHLYIGMGNLYTLGKPYNPNRALSSLRAASGQGGHILAIYHLAEIYAKGYAGRKNCNQAVELYKSVAERGQWGTLHREAYRLYTAGDVDSALMIYLHLGELGIEVAQCNAAYILEEGDVSVLNQTETLKRALVLWSRSASQGYSVARVKLGDYYYYGYGTEKDLELAAEQYRLASDRMSNPQAMFNLGYMYENGIGLQQDYHLAKRYYDLASQTTPDAVVPVNLALIKLNILFYYSALVKGNEDFGAVLASMITFLDQWDIYIIASLCVLLAMLIRQYRR